MFIGLSDGESVLALNGEVTAALLESDSGAPRRYAMQPPLRGASYLPGRVDGSAAAAESLSVLMQGAGAALLAQISALGQMASREALYLLICPLGGEVFRARLSQVTLEYSERPVNLAGGAAGLTLRFLRAPYWEGQRVSLALYNLNARDAEGVCTWSCSPLRVYNAADGRIVNPGEPWVYQNHAAVAPTLGDLPAPLELRLSLPAGFTHLTAALSPDFAQSRFNHTLEAESAGALGAVLNDAACSNGQYRRWNLPVSEALLDNLNPAQTFCTPTQNLYWLLARFASAPAAGGWMRLIFKTGAGPYQDTGAFSLGAGILQKLALFSVPGSASSSGSAAPPQIEVHAWNAAGGVLALDALAFFPCDAVAEFGRSDLSPVPAGSSLTLDWIEQRFNLTTAAGATAPFFDFQAGAGLKLYPARAQSLLFALRAGNTAALTLGFQLSAYYRPRWRLV